MLWVARRAPGVTPADMPDVAPAIAPAATPVIRQVAAPAIAPGITPAIAPGAKAARLPLRSRLKPAPGGLPTGAPFRGLRRNSRGIHAPVFGRRRRTVLQGFAALALAACG